MIDLNESRQERYLQQVESKMRTVITGTSKYAGMEVRVLGKAPRTQFLLPNGALHAACAPDYVIVQSKRGPFKGALRCGMYAAVPADRLTEVAE